MEGPHSSSFENPPSQRKGRKRGVHALLCDITNIPEEPRRKRTCADRASSLILTQCSPVLAHRGDPQKGMASRWLHSDDAQSNPLGGRNTSLCNILRHFPDLYNHGAECIARYIAHTATTEMKRAFALQIFLSVYKKWDKGIVESPEIAAEMVGLSAQSILRWTCSFFISLATWSEPIGSMEYGLDMILTRIRFGDTIANVSLPTHAYHRAYKGAGFIWQLPLLHDLYNRREFGCRYLSLSPGSLSKSI